MLLITNYVYLEISLRLTGSCPRSLKVLNCAYVLWRFQTREMACKKKTRYTQEDLQFALRAVEVAKVSLQLLLFRLIYYLGPYYTCVTPSSSHVNFTILTSKTVLGNSLSPSTATKSPWFSSDSFVALVCFVRDYQPL